MSQRPQDFPPIFQYDVAQDATENLPNNHRPNPNQEVLEMMRQLVIGQDRQNELLEELVDQMNAGQRQRASELGQWKDANPNLAKRCRAAAEALGQVQTEFIETLAFDVNENYESMMEGEFVLNEFVDKYGPRLAHLNGVLQLLSQLSSNNNQVH